tara:strand:- start:3927 stop:4112 length:186 start_codon:yes stop_codon:yes gene_type:complete
MKDIATNLHLTSIPNVIDKINIYGIHLLLLSKPSFAGIDASYVALHFYVAVVQSSVDQILW